MLLYLVVFLCFFFFKQKTAYEMRISDWSSDVCSSDLLLSSRARRGLALAVLAFGIPLTANANVTARNAGGIYDPVTLDAEGPELDEAAGPNPFADYRFDVTFKIGRAHV